MQLPHSCRPRETLATSALLGDPCPFPSSLASLLCLHKDASEPSYMGTGSPCLPLRGRGSCWGPSSAVPSPHLLLRQTSGKEAGTWLFPEDMIDLLVPLNDQYNKANALG